MIDFAVRVQMKVWVFVLASKIVSGGVIGKREIVGAIALI